MYALDRRYQMRCYISHQEKADIRDTQDMHKQQQLTYAVES